VIEAPGHSAGHQMFYFEQENVLMGGDVLFKQSIGRTDLPGGNHEQLLKNIREKVYTLPLNTVVFPGHGPETTVGFEKENNPFVKA
jgi:hydroxyacylglutathione hydrolase